MSESGSQVCSVCGSPMGSKHVSGALTLHRCGACAHRQASHEAAGSEAIRAVDYHSQYDASIFLEALRATRVRQAEAIAGEIVAAVPVGEAAVLDFGSGRGWFLEACQRRGIRALGGADTSALAIGSLSNLGVSGVLLEDFEKLGIRESLEKIRAGLGFSPSVITLLDVAEHFEKEDAAILLRDIREVFGQRLRLLVMKVPVSNGILYRTASALASFGFPGPLEQLYQVGTFPPHFHYFSRGSARKILGRSGYETVSEQQDPDFEADSFSARVHVLSRLPKWLGHLIGRAVFLFSRATGLGDSRIYFARPTNHP